MNSIMEFQINSNDIKGNFLTKVERNECIQENGTKHSSKLHTNWHVIHVKRIVSELADLVSTRAEIGI